MEILLVLTAFAVGVVWFFPARGDAGWKGRGKEMKKTK